MRRTRGLAAAAVLVFGTAGAASAQTTADAVVTYEVAAINEIAVSGPPAKLMIDASSELAGVADSTTTWSVTSNSPNMKVQGSVATLAAGVTLEVELEAPTGATSAGPVSLTTTVQDLVTAIGEVQESGLSVIYTLSALPTAGAVAETTATVTYTLVSGV